MAALSALPQHNWPALNYDQNRIIDKLEEYLKFKRKKIRQNLKHKSKKLVKQELENCVLPYHSTEGLCSGLTAYWLYLKLNGEEGKFIHELTHLLNWNSKQMPAGATEDPIIERFMNATEVLQYDYILRFRQNEVTQENLPASFKLLLPAHAEQLRTEFSISFVFSPQTLSKLIVDVVKPNKMVYLNNIEHAMGFMYSGGVYYLYNSSSRNPPLAYNSAEELAAAIFAEYAPFNAHRQHLTLQMGIFDVETTPMPNYPNPTVYCLDLLATSQVNWLQSNYDIAHVLVKKGAYELLDQLIKLGLPLNKRITETETLAGIAIKNQDWQMLYLLLANGADMSAKHLHSTLWDHALLHRDHQAVILLLAFGYEPPADLGMLPYSFSEEELANIKAQSINLQKQLIHARDTLDLATASGHDLVAFLKHTKLKIQLGQPLDAVTIYYQGEPLTGHDALRAIMQYYKTPSNGDAFDFAQKAEIYKLLKFFKVAHFRFQGSSELLDLLGKIAKQITEKPIEAHTGNLNEMIEIAVILDQLQELAEQPTRMQPNKMRVSHKAASTKRAIEKYLRANNIPSIQAYLVAAQPESHQRNYLFFSVDRAGTTPEVSYMRDVAPMLRLD